MRCGEGTICQVAVFRSQRRQQVARAVGNQLLHHRLGHMDVFRPVRPGRRSRRHPATGRSAGPDPRVRDRGGAARTGTRPKAWARSRWVSPLPRAEIPSRKTPGGWRPSMKKPSRELILAKCSGTVSAPQSEAMMERMMPLCTMSAASWCRALSGVGKPGRAGAERHVQPLPLQEPASHRDVDGRVEDGAPGLHQPQGLPRCSGHFTTPTGRASGRPGSPPGLPPAGCGRCRAG